MVIFRQFSKLTLQKKNENFTVILQKTVQMPSTFEMFGVQILEFNETPFSTSLAYNIVNFLLSIFAEISLFSRTNLKMFIET